MQKSTSLTRKNLAEGTTNVKQVSKNKKPKRGKKPKIIAVAPNPYLKTTKKGKSAGCWAPITKKEIYIYPCHWRYRRRRRSEQSLRGIWMREGYIRLVL